MKPRMIGCGVPVLALSGGVCPWLSVSRRTIPDRRRALSRLFEWFHSHGWNGLYFKCAALPPAALLYLWTHMFSRRRGTLFVCRRRRAGGPHSLKNIVGVTLAVLLLSFAPEMVWRKYVSPNDGSFAALEWVDTPPIRKSKRRSSRLPSA